jgi:exodeoxyribonuclease-3
MDELKILSWNVNGLRTRFKGGYLKQVFELNPDILCFQEVKSTEDQIPKKLKEIEGYYSYFCPSKILKGYAGVAIYSKNKPKTIAKSFSNSDYENEGRILKADYGDFILFNIYFPSGAGSKEKLERKFNFYKYFLDEMKNLSEAGKNVLICGDFNIAHNEIDLVNPERAAKNPGFLKEERAFLDKLINSGYADTFRMFNGDPENYTWWPYGRNCREKNIGMRLDHFFVSGSLKEDVKYAYILSDIKGSDHCPIGVDMLL